MAATQSSYERDGNRYYFKYYRTQWASGTASMVSALASTPFENIKTRMQSHPFKSAADCAKYTWNTEGFRGYTAGALPPLLSITTVRVTGFTVYQAAKYKLSAFFEKTTGVAPLTVVNTPGSNPTLSTILCFTTAGAISGMATTPIACPFELAKNITQTSVLMANKALTTSGASIADLSSTKMPPRIGTVEAIKKIFRLHGVRGLYAGFPLHLARDTIGSGIYFGVYETTKQVLAKYQGATQPKEAFGPVAVAGALCGVVSWIATYPLDTMKTRAQSVLLGKAKDVAEATLKSSTSSTFRGLEVLLLRTSIQNAIFMMTFEFLKIKINDL